MSTETIREYDVSGNLIRQWEIEAPTEPIAENAIATATVDVAALDAALARADLATTTTGKVNAVIAGLRAIRPDGGASA